MFREFLEDAFNFGLHYPRFYWLGVIVPDEMQYSVNKQVKDHFTVCVTQFGSVICGPVRADDNVAQ